MSQGQSLGEESRVPSRSNYMRKGAEICMIPLAGRGLPALRSQKKKGKKKKERGEG